MVTATQDVIGKLREVVGAQHVLSEESSASAVLFLNSAVPRSTVSVVVTNWQPPYTMMLRPGGLD